MKFNFKKIASVLAATAMLGSTIAFAGAAWSGSAADWAVVYGGAKSADLAAATDLASSLTAVTTTGTGVSASLTTSSDKIYLKENINVNIDTLTDKDLPTVLKDGTFEDDAGKSTDYEQTLVVGQTPFTLSDSNGDLDNSALLLDVGDNTINPLYTATVTFNEAVNFTDPNSIGQDIVLFGKTYTIGPDTNKDTLHLLGAGEEIVFSNSMPEKSVVLEGKSYNVKINGVSDDGKKVSVSVNGESKTINEGSSKRIGGVNIFAKDLMHTVGDTWTATIQVGADEYYLENNDNVKTGSTKEDIEGTKVTLNDGGSDPVSALTKIEISVAAEDNDVDDLQVGKEFVDPVFRTFKVVFNDAPNAPKISGDKGTDVSEDRYKVEFKRASDNTISVTTEVKGKSGTVEFANGEDLKDDDGKAIEVVEGATLTEKEYYILQSGNSRHMVQVKKLDCTTGNDNKDSITLRDVFSGEEYKLSDTEFGSGKSWVIDGQTYILTCTADDHATIVSSDYGASTKRYVYPLIKTISGKDMGIAFTDQVTLTDVDDSTIIELPTGEYDTSTYAGTIVDGTNDDAESVLVGTVRYIVDDTGVSGQLRIAIDSGQDVDTTDPATNPGVLFVEEEDNSDSDKMHAVIIPTTVNEKGYTEVDLENISFTSPNVVLDAKFDNSDYSADLDSYGTYVVEDTSHDKQDVAVLTYPEEQMYADVSIAEVSGTGVAAVAPVTDNQVSTVSNKNLLVVGGSCINTVAAKMLTGLETPVCGEAFTALTNVDAGKYLIKVAASPVNSAKMAVLLAGYEAAETQKAVDEFQEGNIATNVTSSKVGPALG